MGSLQRIRQDLRAGWAKLRFGTTQAANRTLEEAELFRLRLAIRKLDAEVEELCRDIGELALDMHERREPIERIMLSSELVRNMDRVCSLRAEQDKLQAELSLARKGK